MKMENVQGGKLGGTNYQMVEAKFNGVVVWPISQPVVITYSILSVNVNYSAGNTLYASGANYATFTGSIQEYHDGQAYGSPFSAPLTPSGIYESNPRVYISGNAVYGMDLGTNEYSDTYWTVALTYHGANNSAYVSQQENVKTVTDRQPTGSKTYGSSSTEYSNYQMTFSSNKYTHSFAGDEAPASGATTSALAATLSVSNMQHLEVDTTPWTQDALVSYHYTSHPETTLTQTVSNYYSGSDVTRSEWVADSLYDITGSAAGFTRNNMTVTVDSEGTQNLPSGRSVTYTARVQKHDSSFFTQQVTLYQQANEPGEWTWVNDITLSMPGVSGNIPQEGGTFNVNYTSRRSGTRTWTSGSTETSTNVPIISEITGTHCTPSVNTVTNGSGTFTIQVPPNTTQGWQISVILSSQEGMATLTKEQDYASTGISFTITGAEYSLLDSDKLRVYWIVTNPFNTSDFSIMASMHNGNNPEKVIIIRSSDSRRSTEFTLSTDFPDTAFFPGATNVYDFIIYDNSGSIPQEVARLNNVSLTY